jgi:ABC-type hemin transport system substrate-binding protein
MAAGLVCVKPELLLSNRPAGKSTVIENLKKELP